MRFRYRNAAGEESIRTLTAWAEEGQYIKGHCAERGGIRTFLKFRVLEYLDGSDRALTVPHMAPPAPPSFRRPPDDRPQILFTGFPRVQRADLERRAEEAGFWVAKGVTQHLAILCGGPNAGPTKLKDARALGSIVLGQAEFLRLCATGEIPDPDEAEAL